MKKIHPLIWVSVIGAIGSIIVAYIGIVPLVMSPKAPTPRTSTDSKQQPIPLTIRAPFNVSTYFFPAGWIGDGEEGTKYIQLNTASREKPRPGDTDNICVKVSYQPGPRGWAGIFWQYPNGNWGDYPGRKIVGATKITFWVTGEKGGEIVEFKAGGIRGANKRYYDSFETSLDRIALTIEWKKYEITLAKQDLSSVIGAFAWVATGSMNPSGLTFYLDDMRYE